MAADDRDDAVRKRPPAGLEKRPPLSVMRGLLSHSVKKEKGRSLSGTALPLSRPRKLAGALRFLPSERYARNSFARTITQASSITRNVRQ
jgi:hypothetical protein